jgi:bacteriorhodopsin
MVDLLNKTHHHYHQHDTYPTTVLWITFIIMVASALGFAVLGASKPLKLRAHAYVATAIVTIAASSYYALATNSGKVPVLTGHGGDLTSFRNVFYVRYIDWTFTTPLLLLSVLLIAGAPFGHVVWILFFDVLMIVLGLVGALTVGHFKWGYFIIACFFQLFITYGILVPGVAAARARNPALVRPYLTYAGFLGLVWIGYPIVWAIAEGTNLITERDEAGAYALLDIIAKPIFGWIVLLGLGPLHQIQLEEERQSGGNYVQPLTTPIGDIWGANTATTGSSTAEGGQDYAPLTAEA